ncbi:MAG: hypothetical protein CM1200mP26_16120 [Acidimicrobiales bacterium]|nr:MAG: hypothetical protein CM1200mP26_16120 [Acidimicrobiales bacterium]
MVEGWDGPMFRIIRGPPLPCGRIFGGRRQNGCLSLTQSEHGTGVVAAQDALG